MPLRLTILNGPNLGLLGMREPEIYGTTSLHDVGESCRRFAAKIGAELQFLQTDDEGELVRQIHQARGTADAVIINPAGPTFHSVAISDALRTFEGPTIELHISNIHARDEMHRHSKISGSVTGVICGLGVGGYVVAMQAAAAMLSGRGEARAG
ncbi:MAG TPA: type II 3-dehydroquinate dehydratase [Afifellaceae bacterium]|nr:type II 3-dehydroquinate dehydratase [Afifellaceae bacterium]